MKNDIILAICDPQCVNGECTTNGFPMWDRWCECHKGWEGDVCSEGKILTLYLKFIYIFIFYINNNFPFFLIINFNK